MDTNIGKAEQLIRVCGGFALICCGIFFGNIWALIGTLVMLTAFIGWCPLSKLWGVSTCRYPEKIPADTRGQMSNRIT
jgi:hypothetical protein